MDKENKRLLALWQNNKDLIARNAVVTNNIKLINFILKKVKCKKEYYEDAFQDAIIILIKCCNTIDIIKNHSFSHYVYTAVKNNYVRKSLKHTSILSVGSDTEKYKKVLKELNYDFSKQNIKAASEKFNISSLEINNLLRVMYPFFGDNGVNDINEIKDQSLLSPCILVEFIEYILDNFKEKELDIIKSLYFEDNNQIQVRKKYNISHSEIKSIENKIKEGFIL